MAPTDDNVAAIVAMGYSEELAKQALEENNDIDDAIDALYMGRVGKKKQQSSDTDETEEEEAGDYSDAEEKEEAAATPEKEEDTGGNKNQSSEDDVKVEEENSPTDDDDVEPVESTEAEEEPSEDTAEATDEAVDDSAPTLVDDAKDITEPVEKDEDSPVTPGDEEVEDEATGSKTPVEYEDEFLGDVVEDDYLVDVAEEEEMGDLEAPPPPLKVQSKKPTDENVPASSTLSTKVSPDETPVAPELSKTEPSPSTTSRSIESNVKALPPEAAVATAAAIGGDEEAQLPSDNAKDSGDAAKPANDDGGNWWSQSSKKKKQCIVIGGLVVLLVVILAIAIPVSRNNNAEPVPAPSPQGGGDDGAPPTPSPVAFAPTEAGTEERTRESIAEMLASISADGGIALNTENSAQYLALDWIMTNANLHVYSEEKLIQRYVMATLYYATNGPTWKDKWGWLTDADECSPDGWFQSRGAIEENLCDANGNLVVLKLIFNRVKGELPNELGLLTSLEVMDFSSNELEGPIFSSIGDLTKLRKLICGLTRVWL